MISTITLNPSVDKTIYITKLLPNDTNRVTKVETDAGGKGVNCARMIRRLGADAKALVLLGGQTGEFVRCVLAKEGIPIEVVETEKATRTCICVEEPGLAPTTFNERGGPIEHKELVAFFEKAKDTARESNFVVFGGSVPMGINPDVYKVLIQIAVASGAKAVLDSDGDAFAEAIKSKPFMIKPNLDETQRLLDKSFDSKTEVARAALTLAEMGIELVVISLGKQGAVAAYGGSIYDVVPPPVRSESTVGSGDSMIAGMLAVLEQGGGMKEALRYGCAAGAATAMSSGSDIGTKEDADRLLSDVKVTRVEPAKC